MGGGGDHPCARPERAPWPLHPHVTPRSGEPVPPRACLLVCVGLRLWTPPTARAPLAVIHLSRPAPTPPAPTPRAPTPRAPSRMRPVSCLPTTPTTCSRLLHFAFCICNCDSSQGSCHPVTSRQGATVVSGPSPTSSAVTATDKIQGQVGGRRFLSVLLVSAGYIVVTFTET